MSKLKEDILKLRQEGKTYNQIVEILQCSKGSVCYYCGDNQKDKSTIRTRRHRKQLHPFTRKLQTFQKIKKSNKTKTINTLKQDKHPYYNKLHKFNGATMENIKFSINDIISKYTENPKCYLTGDDININETRSYEFDHIIPSSRGGDNSLSNLGIATKQANQAKSNMTPDELIFLCKKILENNGYIVNKISETTQT